MGDHEVTPRARVFFLVHAYAKRTGSSPAKTWEKLYREFEYRSNKPWKKLAHNNGTKVLEEIHSHRKLDELLICAREYLGPSTEESKEGGA